MNIQGGVDDRKYAMELGIINQHPSLSISSLEYENIKIAKDKLVAALKFEEIFEVLIRGYLNMETEVFRLTTEQATRFRFDYESIFEIGLTVNKSLMDFLNASGLYVETAIRHASKVSDSPNKLLELDKRYRAALYDDNIEYRTMEAFRNHVKHHGLAVHTTPFGSKYDSEKDVSKYFLKANALKKRLMEDGGFKKSVLTEIEEVVNLHSYIRKYMSCLGARHELLRGQFSVEAKEARKIIENALTKYRREYSQPFDGLELVIRDGENIVECFHATLVWDEIRVKLESENRNLEGINSRIVDNSHM